MTVRRILNRCCPLLSLLSALLLAVDVSANESTGFLGNAACAGCHDDIIERWTGSHHDLAMQEATSETVLGDFDNAQFTHGEVTTTFSRDGNRFLVRTDDARGEMQTYEVAYVFGVEPLQQLLLPLPGGRLQALSIAWDSRPKAGGGQRWYHIYERENETIPAGDPLHWTGIYHNWNARCAECHSTNVVKGYDAVKDEYTTRYDQIDVGCEACHGPGKTHVSLAHKQALESAEHAGFALSLAARGQWVHTSKEAIASRSEPLNSNTQIDNCGRCHARRGTLGDYHYGADLLDTHRLATLDQPLYWPDGQIRDEVYVYGSFVQSKMHQAGVVCSNCHEPHTAKLRAEGNAICSQCHKASVYDNENHHRHPVASAGAQCTNCHMAPQVYMGVDWRRDHSMRIPRPDVSLKTGSPNACTQCHDDQTDSWALDSLRGWGVETQPAAINPGPAFHQADTGDVRALPTLKALVDGEAVPDIIKASAVSRLTGLGAPDAGQTIAMLLGSSSPLIRMNAAQTLSSLPPRQRYLALRTLVNDPILSVRMTVASLLAATPVTELRDKDLAPLKALFSEYEQVQNQHLDMPTVRLQLSNYWRDRGDNSLAEQQLRKALEINPHLQAASLNLAELLRQTGRADEAQKLLEGQLDESAPAPFHHALGLMAVRQGRTSEALEHLETAARLDSDDVNYRYVYAIALNDTGEPDKAIAELESLNRDFPGNPQVLFALINYAQQSGDYQREGRYRAQWGAIAAEAGVN
ncbi:TPR domain protein [Luminiphilus syltensis NOR5-1B]|uniref:TPR domain protein n=1 Tax=Luminiphilus syltensis NOR5-1B TaxID=565045 RepID=B8KUM3_9GAMM|nr:tetratricopeptide repeat protein [Luminiphilus syltensis]EED34684.1 TPR domain protein [Luminiphilus syltensis NOR5-1B]